jgi:signal transduction histidine kinase
LDHGHFSTVEADSAILAHELASPLNGLQLGIMALEHQLPEQALRDRGTRQSLDTLSREIGRLGRLLAQFRLLAGRWQLSMTPLDIRPLVERVLAMQAVRLRTANVKVRNEIGDCLEAFADDDKLMQVLLNLVGNAIDAMPTGGTLSFFADREGTHVDLQITDTGGGLPTDLDVFAPYVTTKRDGTGLGLPIARRIVEAHGGQLRWFSVPDVGTTFVIRLRGLHVARAQGVAAR